MADENKDESEKSMGDEYTEADERYVDGILRAVRRLNGEKVEGESPYEDDDADKKDQ